MNIISYQIKARLVILLVDAMRYDFIFEKAPSSSEEKSRIKNPRMPFINRLITEKKAKPFKLSAKPPTVTLPRLKVNIIQSTFRKYYF